MTKCNWLPASFFLNILRRCTPVVQDAVVDGELRLRKGVWMPHGPKACEGLVLWDKWASERVQHRVYEGLVSVDLSDPTGQLHAAMWLYKKLDGAEPPSGFGYSLDKRILQIGPYGIDVYRASMEEAMYEAMLSVKSST